jgi:hypothetical protein
MGTKFDDYMAAADTTATEDERELATAFDAHYKAVYLESVLTRSWLRLARRGRVQQIDLSELSEIPRPEISRVESGQANPTQKTLARLGASFSLGPCLPCARVP